MADGISITDAIAALRRLHDAGYDLAPLLAVAQQHEPDLRAIGGEAERVAARYREKLAAECGAPSLPEFNRTWFLCDLGPYDAERVEYAWRQMSCDQRTAAVAGIQPFKAARDKARLTRKVSAAGYLLAGSWITP